MRRCDRAAAPVARGGRGAFPPRRGGRARSAPRSRRARTEQLPAPGFRRPPSARRAGRGGDRPPQRSRARARGTRARRGRASSRTSRPSRPRGGVPPPPPHELPTTRPRWARTRPRTAARTACCDGWPFWIAASWPASASRRAAVPVPGEPARVCPPAKEQRQRALVAELGRPGTRLRRCWRAPRRSRRATTRSTPSMNRAPPRPRRKWSYSRAPSNRPPLEARPPALACCESLRAPEQSLDESLPRQELGHAAGIAALSRPAPPLPGHAALLTGRSVSIRISATARPASSFEPSYRSRRPPRRAPPGTEPPPAEDRPRTRARARGAFAPRRALGPAAAAASASSNSRARVRRVARLEVVSRRIHRSTQRLLGWSSGGVR